MGQDCWKEDLNESFIIQRKNHKMIEEFEKMNHHKIQFYLGTLLTRRLVIK
jgi:hypothetical protein